MAQTDPYEIWTQASIYRDEWGVPHVYGDNPRALAFAFGYAQAEDHLEPMLLAYRVANGRAAEAFGEAYAASDEFALKMGHGILAEQAYPQADPVTVDLCEGFAQGVNAWMVDHPDRVPAWSDGVRPVDILALLHCYLMTMAPFDMPKIFHANPASFSGNAWALGPSRSTTGEPLLAINAHQYYDGVFRWYEAHLVSGDFNVAGATLFGLPVILMGHNADLGWALTPNRPDFADVYVEPVLEAQRDPGSVQALIDPQAVLYAALLAHSRTFYVAGEGGMAARQVPCVFTPRGPVIGEDQGRLMTYRIGGYGRFGALRQLVEMGRARDLGSFQAALTMQQLPSFHVVYADRQGNVFYLYNALVGDKAVSRPRESAGDGDLTIDWNKPIPGGNPLYEWGNLVAPGALPSLQNPESGYVQACGNPPWLATDDAPINPEALPPWFVHDPDTYRARRARLLLKLGARSFEDMQAMLFDILVPFAVDAVPGLLKVADEKPEFVEKAHPDLPVGLDLLRSWNYTADPDSAGMTFFHVWWATLQQQAGARFRDEYAMMDAVLEGGPEAEEATLQAAAEAAKLMRNEYQSLSVPWGDVHLIRRGERTAPLPGTSAGEPIFFSSDFRLEEGKWTANYGYGFAMVVKFGETPQAVSVVPFGASENTGASHYDDQLDLLAQRRLKTAHFTRDDVLSHTEAAFGRIVEIRPKGLDGRLRVRVPAPVALRVDASLEPPAPLPEGLTTFTVYVTPRELPENMPAAIELEARIAPEICAAEDLKRLSVYAYTKKDGWQAVELQELDEEAATLLATDEVARTYAVLGPPDASPSHEKPLPFVPTPPMTADARGVQPVPPSIFKVAEEIPESALQSSSPTSPASEPSVSTPEAPAGTAVASATPPESAPEPLRIDQATLEKAAAQEQPSKPGLSSRQVKAEDLKVKATGPVGSGEQINLRTPDEQGAVLIAARSAIEARLVTLEEPPAPLPDGLAAFTEYIGLDRRPPTSRVEVTLKLVVPTGACAPENLGRLKLYGFRPDKGWYELADAVTKPEERSYSGVEKTNRTFRVYAVLGPAECLVRP